MTVVDVMINLLQSHHECLHPLVAIVVFNRYNLGTVCTLMKGKQTYQCHPRSFISSRLGNPGILIKLLLNILNTTCKI